MPKLSKGGVRYPNSITVPYIKTLCMTWLGRVNLQYDLNGGEPPLRPPYVEIEKYASEIQRLTNAPNICIHWSGIGGGYVLEGGRLTPAYEHLLICLSRILHDNDMAVRQYHNREGSIMCKPRLWWMGWVVRDGKVVQA